MKLEKNKLILSREEIEKIYNELNSLFDIVDPFPETLLSLMLTLKPFWLERIKKKAEELKKDIREDL